MSLLKKAFINHVKNQLFKDYEKQWESELKAILTNEASRILKASLEAISSIFLLLYSLILLTEIGTQYFYKDDLLVGHIIQFSILLFISGLLIYSACRFFIEFKKRIYYEKNRHDHFGQTFLRPFTKQLKDEHTKMLKEYF